MKAYDEVCDNLIDILENLDEHLGKITPTVGLADEPSAKIIAEQAIEIESNEVQDIPANATRDEMNNIRQTIERIDNREYGSCVVCGELIQKNRLKALPFSAKCVKCDPD